MTEGEPDLPTGWLSPPDLAAARVVQAALAGRVEVADRLGAVTRVGGCDISHAWRQSLAPVHAALVSLDWPALTPVASAGASAVPVLPYIPGFLGFRECPSLVAAWRAMPRSQRPDLLFVDGHGVSHPRGLGIASHLGVLLDVPTIGIAKSILVGAPAGPLGSEPGDRVALVWRGRAIGTVLRSKRGCRPLYVSAGHRVSPATAVAWTLQALRRHRLPEPTRLAHLAANARRQGANSGEGRDRQVIEPGS